MGRGLGGGSRDGRGRRRGEGRGLERGRQDGSGPRSGTEYCDTKKERKYKNR